MQVECAGAQCAQQRHRVLKQVPAPHPVFTRACTHKQVRATGCMQEECCAAAVKIDLIA